VVHLHFLLWRDKGVPDDMYPLLAFRRKVRSLDAGSTGPLLIHCSAGVGRSGTYMALDMLLDEVKRCGEVDVLAVVTHLRRQRMSLVQTKVLYYITNTHLPSHRFYRAMPRRARLKPKSIAPVSPHSKSVTSWRLRRSKSTAIPQHKRQVLWRGQKSVVSVVSCRFPN